MRIDQYIYQLESIYIFVYIYFRRKKYICLRYAIPNNLFTNTFPHSGYFLRHFVTPQMYYILLQIGSNRKPPRENYNPEPFPRLLRIAVSRNEQTIHRFQVRTEICWDRASVVAGVEYFCLKWTIEVCVLRRYEVEGYSESSLSPIAVRMFANRLIC